MGFLRRLFAGSSGKKQATVGAAVLTGVLGLTITGTTVVGGESALEGPPSLYPGTTSISFPSCPSTPTVTLTGTRNGGYLNDTPGDNAYWDMTAATWEGSPANYLYPMRSNAWTTGCVKGGTVNGTIPEVPRNQWKDVSGVGGGESHYFTMTTANGNWVYFEDGYATHVEDVIDPNGRNNTHSVYVDHMKMERIPDDCFENEGPSEDVNYQPSNLYIFNTYCEGFTIFASRPCQSCTAKNGTTPVVHHVENSLFHVGKYLMPEGDCTAARVTSGRCENTGTAGVYWGSLGIWKWSDEAPSTVIVRDTIFRIDLVSYSSCNAQVWPDGTYENVTLVYTGPGTYGSVGGCTNTLPSGVTLTTDVSVWDDAVAAWNSQ